MNIWHHIWWSQSKDLHDALGARIIGAAVWTTILFGHIHQLMQTVAVDAKTTCWTCSCIHCLASPLAPLIEEQMQKIFTNLYHNTCLHYLFPEVFNSLYFLFNWQLLGKINISYLTFPRVCIKSVNMINTMYWIYCRIHTSLANTLRLFNIILEASSSLSDFFCPST